MDVDKNIDINDVSTAGEVGTLGSAVTTTDPETLSPRPGDTQLPGGSKK